MSLSERSAEGDENVQEVAPPSSPVTTATVEAEKQQEMKERVKAEEVIYML